MERINILGVKVSRVTYEYAIKIIEGFLTDEGKHQIVTPNPEFVVLAQKDLEFRTILNRADLTVPDGVGLRVAAKFLSLPTFNFTIVKFFQLLFQGLLVGAAAVFKPSFLDVLPHTVTGTDLMLGLCDLASKKGYSVFLLGGRGGAAEAAAKRLKVRFANLNIIGTYEGGSWEEFEGKTADFLFVAYGAPKQEKWIARNLPKISVKVAMGVGAGIDFTAGRKKRAPGILRRLGFEWLWRLVQEPFRLRRILNATVKFPLLVFWQKLSQK